MEGNLGLVILVGGFLSVAFLIFWLQDLVDKRSQHRREQNKVKIEFIHTDDMFITFYGIKICLDDAEEEEIEACETNNDSRCLSAINAGLETLCDRFTEGEDIFLYIGKKLNAFDFSHSGYVGISNGDILAIIDDVNKKLEAAGFAQESGLHMQVICNY